MNGHVGIDTLEATEHLKNILNVGRSESESGKCISDFYLQRYGLCLKVYMYMIMY